MKILATLASILAIPTIANAAATYTVINFGPAGEAEIKPGVTVNPFSTVAGTGQDAVTNMALNTTTGSDSGIRFTTSLAVTAAGAAGTFEPVGNVSYSGVNTVINGWIDNEQAAFGDIWQGAANATNGNDVGQVVDFTFTGLVANTGYTFKLLSVRANDFGGEKTGAYNMVYGNLGFDPSLTGGGTHPMGGSADGLNATEYTWTFTTGDTPKSATIRLSGSWNINALIIHAVPEPSSLALLGLGGLTLFRRRRS